MRACTPQVSARRFAAVIALCVSSLGAGCASLPRPTPRQKNDGMVFILPGIEGQSYTNRNIARGLRMGGVTGGVYIYDWTTWTGPLGWYIHLTDTHRNRSQAAHLARRIIKHIEAYPDRPVFVVGHSGGGGIAIMAVEMLPKSHPVDGIILLAAAVSPERDLSRSLSHTRRGIWNFYSPRDVAFLVVGTSIFGTIDRRFGPAAGAVGFETPEGLSENAARLYEKKLTQIAFEQSMAVDGHVGQHNGWTRCGFVARWLAPIVLGNNIPESADWNADDAPDVAANHAPASD